VSPAEAIATMAAVEAKQQRLLVLGAGREQLGLLRAARRRRLVVIAVDSDAAAPGFRVADRRALIACDDEPAIHRLSEAERIDGIISPANDWSVGIAARVAHRLGIPHPLDPATASLASSRLKQHERFAAVGLPHSLWRGEEPEETVHGFSVGGEFHPLLGAADAVALAAHAVAALGIVNGPTCTRLRAGRRLELVEVAARLGTNHETERCLAETGIDVNALALSAALGERVELAAGRKAA
jgi:hypothetical protein